MLWQQQHRQRLLQRWGRWRQPLGRQFDPHHPPLHKLMHRCGVAEIELPRRADHHHLPLIDRSALAILLLQQPPGFGIQTQQEAWISCHLGFQDQGRQIRLIGGRQEQPIEAIFPFFEHRRVEHITVHPRQEGSHQGLQAFGMLLEQPVEELVAGDHSRGDGWLLAPRMACSVDRHPEGRRHQPSGFGAMMGTNAQGKRCLKSPANALIASGSIENTTG